MTLTPQACLLLGQVIPSPPPVEPSSRSCQSLSSFFHSMDTSSCVCTEESCSPSPGESKHHYTTRSVFSHSSLSSWLFRVFLITCWLLKSWAIAPSEVWAEMVSGRNWSPPFFGLRRFEIWFYSCMNYLIHLELSIPVGNKDPLLYYVPIETDNIAFPAFQPILCLPTCVFIQSV